MLTPAESDRLCVVLVSTRNPLNIGAVARAMGNFGFSRLRVVNPYEEAFREARSAAGASAILAAAEQYGSVADAVADCSLVVGTTAGHQRQVAHTLEPLRAAAPHLRERLVSSRAALLFGSEKRGLSNRDFTHCHRLLAIPTSEQYPSMNLGQAAAVCFYELSRGELSRGNEDAPAPQPEQATSGALERIASTMFELLSASGYIKPGSADASREKLGRLIRRLHLDQPDAEMLLGMLHKVSWKLQSIPKE